MYDIDKIRADFPILSKEGLVFLDSAASAQKPKSVINRIKDVFENEYSNVHRGSYSLSENLTKEYEDARQEVASFINAETKKEVIYTRGATEAINLVANSWGKKFLSNNDEVIISEAEHHANLVPWQLLSKEIGFELKICKVTDEGEFDFEDYKSKLSKKTKLVAITHVSNVLGTVFPIKKIIDEAKKYNSKTLIDGCQGIVHEKVNVKDLDCDFYVFSGHKLYGPTGIGILYGKYDILTQMNPYQYGGDMVTEVTYQETKFDLPPARFEAGTPAIAEAVALGEAIKYINSIGIKNIIEYENKITKYAMQELSKIDAIKLVGSATNKIGVFSFVINNVHSDDASFIFNKMGICVRTGSHCAQPLVNRMGHKSVIRASIGLYNTKEEIDSLIKAIYKVQEICS